MKKRLLMFAPYGLLRCSGQLFLQIVQKSGMLFVLPRKNFMSLQSKKPNIKDESSLKKHHELVVMVPKLDAAVFSGQITTLTPLSRKLYNAILKETQRQWAEITVATGQPLIKEQLFTSRLKDLLKLATSSKDFPASDIDGIYKTSQESLREMKEINVEWRSAEKGRAKSWKSVSLLSQVEIFEDEGILHVEWDLPAEIFARIVDEKSRFFELNLEDLSKLKTYGAIALYEIASGYKDIYNTSAHPPEWWISALTARQKKKREWRNVKYELVNRAVDEINANTSITLTYPIESRETGPKSPVISVHFGVKQKPQAQTIEKKSTISVEIQKKAQDQLIPLLIVKRMTEEFPCKGEAIIDLALSRMDARTESIEKRIPYFIAVCREIAANDPSATVEFKAKEWPNIKQQQQHWSSPLVETPDEKQQDELSLLTPEQFKEIILKAFEDSTKSFMRERELTKFLADQTQVPLHVRIRAIKILQEKNI